MATNKSAGSLTEIRIGITETNQELHLEVEVASDEVAAMVDAAIESGKSFKITDTKGRQTIVPATKIAFVEVGPAPERRVGFASN